jgi:hypothetical protein
MGTKTSLSYLLLIGWLAGISLSLPHVNTTTFTTLAANDLESLNKEFLGMQRGLAFGPNDCNEEQRARMIRAFRDVAKILSALSKDRATEKEMMESWGWERYFGQYKAWKDESGPDGIGKAG